MDDDNTGDLNAEDLDAFEKLKLATGDDAFTESIIDTLFGVIKDILPTSIADERVEILDSSFCKGKGLFSKEEIMGSEILLIEDPFAYVNLVRGSSSFCKVNPFLEAVDAPKFFGDPDYMVGIQRTPLPVTINLMLSVADALAGTSNVRAWCKLFSHENLTTLDMHIEPLKLALKAFKREFPSLDRKTVTLLFNTVHCNSLLAKSPLMIDVIYGAGFWIKGARINHSCDPNCMEAVVRGKLYVIAVRDIAVGEELTMDYNRHYGSAVFCSMYRVQQSPEQKRGRDKGMYGFECTCPECAKRKEGSPTVAKLSKIGVEDLKLRGEDLRKWNSSASLMYTSFYQVAKDYNPGGYRSLSISDASAIRKSILSIIDDAAKTIAMTKSNNPLKILGMHPFSTLVRLVLMELIHRGRGNDFTAKKLRNAKAIAGYLIKRQKSNDTLEEIETAMVATALRFLIDGYESDTSITGQSEIVNFTETFVINMSIMFWVPFVYPMLEMKEGHISFAKILGMTCFSFSQNQKIAVYETDKKKEEEK